ncbi:MAG: ABC transporter ATP-binding protein/permease [Candidatus Accumulibacter sp.]|jgi:putative ATP-binding cassette transporter|nr:ABC transporter ATP-binding protein/permease [Accumulibacter sp.]
MSNIETTEAGGTPPLFETTETGGASPLSLSTAPASPRRSWRERAAAAWRLLLPYWVSEERWRARGLLALIIAIDGTRTYAGVQLSYWQRDYWDALAAYDLAAFWNLLWVFVIIVAVWAFIDTMRIWFFQALEMRWRAWMTDVFLHRWLDGNAYYRIARAGNIDNPDQRIGEDLQMLATRTMNMSLGLLNTIANLVTYSVIVWNLSDSLALTLGGVRIEIPGYMLWVAVAYAVFGSWLMEKIGHELVLVDYQQQRYEAHFRFLMMRIRENAEQISFYSGGRAEIVRLRAAFLTIRENWARIMDYSRRIALFREGYGEISNFLPLLIIGPRYFAREITLGSVQQLTQSFGRVRGALSWFIAAYRGIAMLRAVFRRLLEFEEALKAQETSDIAVTMNARPDCLEIRALDLRLPSGEPLVHIGNVTFRAGERWVVRGHSGVGKSTLLRALAGLWPHGGGEIAMPEGRKMFLPQKSYLPIASLRACLCYPSDEQWFGVGECVEVLRAARLESLTGELDTDDNWEKRLSPGEQQRLAFARVLLHKPDWIFLDEATASLDPANEAAMYRLLAERLPNAAIISVAHRESVAAFHDKALDLSASGVKEISS